jgi:hypothetical protein
VPKPIIDNVKLNQMLRAGKPQKEIAQFFGVTAGAISKRKKELNINVVKNIALENAGRIVDKNLNAVEQLQKINDYANELLDLLMRWNRGDSEALQVLESQVATKKVRIGDQEEFVKEFKFKDPRELALKAMAEIRGQLKLQLEIFQALYDMKAIEEFQQEVLTAIGEVSKDVRDKIINRLNKRRALRTTIKFN